MHHPRIAGHVMDAETHENVSLEAVSCHLELSLAYVPSSSFRSEMMCGVQRQSR